METITDYLLCSLLTGSGATALMDVWALVLGGCSALRRWTAAWLAAGSPAQGERLIAHCLSGTAFAAVLLAFWGLDWARPPSIGPARIVGIGSVAAPFLWMRPGMGAGVAASRAPRRAGARFHSLVAHAVFGLGLYP